MSEVGLLLSKEEIREAVRVQGHRTVAEKLKYIGVPFDDAYELIFGQKPEQYLDLDFTIPT